MVSQSADHDGIMLFSFKSGQLIGAKKVGHVVISMENLHCVKLLEELQVLQLGMLHLLLFGGRNCPPPGLLLLPVVG